MKLLDLYREIIEADEEAMIHEWKIMQEFNYNLVDIYKIDKENNTKYIKGFYDNLNRLNLIKAKKVIEPITGRAFFEIKIYWVKEDGTPSYDDPPNTTPKTFNTHLKIFINDFLPLHDIFILQPTTPSRQRLFKVA